MIKGGWKSVGFLGATAAVVGWELFASFDGDPDTSPWTDLTVTYVPGEVTAALIGALITWLPVHFWIRYRRRARDQERQSRVARDVLHGLDSSHADDDNGYNPE